MVYSGPDAIVYTTGGSFSQVAEKAAQSSTVGFHFSPKDATDEKTLSRPQIMSNKFTFQVREVISCSSSPYASNDNVTTGQVTGGGSPGSGHSRRRLLSPRRRLFTNVVASSPGKARTVSSQRADNGDGWFEYYTKSPSVAILGPASIWTDKWLAKWGTATSRNSRLAGVMYDNFRVEKTSCGKKTSRVYHACITPIFSPNPGQGDTSSTVQALERRYDALDATVTPGDIWSLKQGKESASAEDKSDISDLSDSEIGDYPKDQRIASLDVFASASIATAVRTSSQLNAHALNGSATVEAWAYCPPGKAKCGSEAFYRDTRCGQSWEKAAAGYTGFSLLTPLLSSNVFAQYAADLVMGSGMAWYVVRTCSQCGRTHTPWCVLGCRVCRCVVEEHVVFFFMLRVLTTCYICCAYCHPYHYANSW